MNGILKRFSCLSKKLRTKLSTTLLIIAACAVLHNIATLRHENLPLNKSQDLSVSIPPQLVYNGPPNIHRNIVRELNL